MRMASWMMAGVLVAMPLATAGGAAAQPLRMSLEFDPAPLDPATDGSYTNRIVTSLMCDSLIDITPDLKFVPELATSWEWGADRLSLTLKLREGVRFQDGTPFDAEAMAANIKRYKTADYSIRKTEMAAISGTEVVDQHTLKVNLSRPYAPLIALLSNRPGTPYSPKILNLPKDQIAAKPVCAGPFAFKDRVAQDRITLERFGGYWNAGAIKLPGVVFRTITDSNIRHVDLAAGALDISNKISPTDAASIAKDPKLRLARSPSLGFSIIEFNVANGPAADTPLGRDARVRRAFSMAIDRTALNQVAFDGQYIPSNQMEAPGSYYADARFKVGERDVAGAKKLMAEAGVKELSFTLQTGTDPLDAQVAQIIQAMVKDVGFDMKIRASDSAALVAATRGGNFEASLLLWSGRADPDGNAPIWLTCKGFTNWGHYCNPKMDDLLQQATVSSDPAERKKIYDQATELFLADQPDVVPYHFALLWGLSAKVQGFKGRPDGLFRPEGMSISP
jgi:peptide/nickel transport system substrate-binding protein